MEVYLIRHTTPDIASGICYGQSDIPLKQTFYEEAKAVVKALPKSVDVVYTSPLIRCITLAKILGPDQLVTDPRLMELNFGDWELKHWDDLPMPKINEWMSDFVNSPPPGGESMIQLQERVLDWYEELNKTKNQRIAVVTHAGVIRIIKAHLNKISLQDSFNKIKVGYGEVVFLNIESRCYQ